jgi:hypothetical protein
MEIEKTDSHIPSASATAKLIPNQNTKGAFPCTITPHPSGSSFDWKRLKLLVFARIQPADASGCDGSQQSSG